jgi:hypothetical protein
MSNQNADSVQTQEPAVQNESSNGKVSYETYLKVLGEAKKAKEERNALLAEKSKVDESKLKENNEWKTLADQYKEKLDQTTQTLQEQEKSIINGLKYHEFEKHLGGKLKDRDYATFVEFDKIILHPETRHVEESSVKSVVSEFLKKHSSLVEFQGGGKLPVKAAESFDAKKEKSYKEMTTAELENEIRKLGKI